MKNRKCIRIVSRLCRFICSWVIFFTIMAIALVFLGGIIALFDPEASPESLELYTIPMLACIFSFGVILTAASLYGLFKLRSLLKLYEKEVYYSQRNVSCFRGMGWALIVFNLAGMIMFCAILQMPDPLGALVDSRPKNAFSFLVDLPSSFNLIFAGIVLLVISWAVDEGRKIKEDQEQFV